jgi:hypothetical protein
MQKEKPKTNLREALDACNEAADKMGVTDDVRRMMVIAAWSTPTRARSCYQAIIRSYRRQENEQPGRGSGGLI